MAAEPRIIDVEPGTEVARLLEEVATEPVVLTSDGKRFRLERELPHHTKLKLATPEEIRRPPTPEEVIRSIAGIRAAAGGWSSLNDPEEFKAYIRIRRRTKNRPSVRW